MMAGGRGGARKARAVTSGLKPSAIDALTSTDCEVPGAPGYTYTIGGHEAGGPDATRVLREVEIDHSALELKQQFAAARRVVLSRDGRVVAAAIAEAHTSASPGVLEIPILASNRAFRQQGNGSVLVALLMELGAMLDLKVLVISATHESRRFWLGQGLHVASGVGNPHLDPRAATALRTLAQHGVRYGRFSDTTQMARMIPPCEAPGSLIGVATRRAHQKTPTERGLTAAKAAEHLDYEDMPPGAPSFYVLGGAHGGTRVAVNAPPAEAKAGHVKLSNLQAFPTGLGGGGSGGAAPPDGGGWGVPGGACAPSSRSPPGRSSWRSPASSSPKAEHAQPRAPPVDAAPRLGGERRQERRRGRGRRQGRAARRRRRRSAAAAAAVRRRLPGSEPCRFARARRARLRGSADP